MKTLLYLSIVILPLWSQTPDQNWLGLMQGGRSLRASGQYSRSIERFIEAVGLADMVDASGRAKLLATTALAGAYADSGETFNASKAYARALTTAQSSWGRESREYAIVEGSLGGLYLEQGELTRAEPLLREALRTLLQLGVATGDEAMVRQQIALGQLLTMQGKYGQAAIPLAEAAASRDAELRLTAMNALGVVRLRERRVPEAMELFEAGLGTARELEGGGVFAIRLLTNLADAELTVGRTTDAAKAYREAVAIDEKRGVEDQARGTLLKQYAELLRKSGHCAESRSYRAQSQRVLQSAARASGTGSQVDLSAMMRNVR